MRLRALTGLEREKLEAEYAELMEKIRKFQAILADRKLLLRVIREEILAIAEKYGDDRKTSIGYDVYDISTEDLIPRENTVIAMDKVWEQAENYGHSREREYAFLIAHSMLHLFGYDHMEEEERKDMEKRQEEILTKTKYTRDERGLV